MKLKLAILAFAATALLSCCKNTPTITPDESARIGALLDVAVSAAQSRGIITGNDAGLIRAADNIVLPSATAPATTTISKAGALADLAVSAALVHGAITTQDATDLRAASAIVLPSTSASTAAAIVAPATPPSGK